MSQFRAAKLDIGCFTKIRNIRDHTKRKVYAENEPERYATTACFEMRTTDSPQTSPPLHYPQHHSAAASARPGPAPAFADALLHEVHPDQEQMYNGRQGARCLQRLQDGSCMLLSLISTRQVG
jgi:hypothetical protein